jgi:hypothetical protein
MTNPLRIAPPPPRRSAAPVEPPATVPERAPVTTIAPPSPAPGPKFRQVKEDERVQFNKRVTRRVADGFEILAIRSRRKVPELLAEALDLLEDRYGKVG